MLPEAADTDTSRLDLQRDLCRDQGVRRNRLEEQWHLSLRHYIRATCGAVQTSQTFFSIFFFKLLLLKLAV